MLGAEQRGNGNGEGGARANTALIDGIRRYVMDVRELDSDLIDRINPFEAAYAVLAKAMDEERCDRFRRALHERRSASQRMKPANWQSMPSLAGTARNAAQQQEPL